MLINLRTNSEQDQIVQYPTLPPPKSHSQLCWVSHRLYDMPHSWPPTFHLGYRISPEASQKIATVGIVVTIFLSLSCFEINNIIEKIIWNSKGKNAAWILLQHVLPCLTSYHFSSSFLKRIKYEIDYGWKASSRYQGTLGTTFAVPFYLDCNVSILACRQRISATCWLRKDTKHTINTWLCLWHPWYNGLRNFCIVDLHQNKEKIIYCQKRASLGLMTHELLMSFISYTTGALLRAILTWTKEHDKPKAAVPLNH